MATREGLDWDVQNLQKEIECPVCRENYDDPRVLPCLHYYCKKCIHGLAFRKGASRAFLCPECRRAMTLSEKDLEELRPAFFVNRFKTTILSTLEEYSLTKSRSKIAECSVHQESLKLYCFSCDVLICRDCVLKDHKDCNYEFVSKLAPDARGKLREKLDSLKKVESKLKTSGSHIEEAVGQVNNKREELIEMVHTRFNELHRILDEREQQMVKDTEQMVQSKLDDLLQRGNEISESSAEVRRVLEQVEDCATRLNDAEVVMKQVSVLERVDQVTQLHDVSGDPKLSFELNIEIKLDCKEALQDFLQRETRIGPKEANPGKSGVDFDRTKSVEVGVLQEVTLTVRNADGNPCEKECDVTSRLTCLRTNEVTDCDVTSVTRSSYSVQFTPSSRGRHTLAVLVNKVAVCDSPFSIFVSINPKDLVKPVDIWPNIQQVTGIAANSDGEIIVTEESGEISVRSCAGDKLRCLTSAEHRLKSTYDVVVDTEDKIYCGDYYSNRIFTCDKDLNNRKVSEVPVIKKGRRGMAVSEDEIFICEQNVVKIWNKEFSPIRKLDSKHLSLARFVRVGKDKLLYVTDKHKAAVQVFKDGQLERSIGLGKDGEQILSNPLGLCIFGSHVFVTDYSKSDVSVFTTEGEWVASIGQKGSEEGSFQLPHGICVDRDGFVYVADRNNNRVQVF